MGIGLVLSGGGSKGAAHIGVIKAFKEENISIDYISGTSSGSIIASLYALGYSPEEMKSIFLKYCKNITDIDRLIPIKILNCFFSDKLCIKGICKGKSLEKIMSIYCEKKKIINISDIKIPIVAIPTVDVKTGEIVYFLNRKIQNKYQKENVNLYDDNPTYYYNENIASIVRASCSLPAIYPPKKIKGHMLVDGGIRLNTPVSILRKMGAKNIVAVTFDSNKHRVTECNNIISITMQAFDVMCHQINQDQLDSANILIRPKLEDASLLGCDKINEYIESGYNETKKKISVIKKLC